MRRRVTFVFVSCLVRAALREKIMLERASIAGGATVAVILVVILSIIFYSYVRQRRKEHRLG